MTKEELAEAKAEAKAQHEERMARLTEIRRAMLADPREALRLAKELS